MIEVVEDQAEESICIILSSPGACGLQVVAMRAVDARSPPSTRQSVDEAGAGPESGTTRSLLLFEGS